MKLLSIIIPIYNRINVTKEGLDHIAKSIDYYIEYFKNLMQYDVNIIIVDDGSTDGSGEWIGKYYKNIIVINTGGEHWWTGSANYGIRYAIDTFKNLSGIIMQNDDVIVEKEWIYYLVSSIKRFPNALIGCATTTFDKYDRIMFGGVVMHPWFAKTKFKNLNSVRSNFPKGYTEESFYLSGRGLYIPVSVFSKIGFFDYKRFKHRGDVDLPMRARKKGYLLIVSYDPIVFELPQHTFGLDIKKKMTIKELYIAMTDFRSSYSLEYIFNSSRSATNNLFQFSVFFVFNFLSHIKTLLKRAYF